jgi:hypothetical protein
LAALRKQRRSWRLVAWTTCRRGLLMDPPGTANGRPRGSAAFRLRGNNCDRSSGRSAVTRHDLGRRPAMGGEVSSSCEDLRVRGGRGPSQRQRQLDLRARSTSRRVTGVKETGTVECKSRTLVSILSRTGRSGPRASTVVVEPSGKAGHRGRHARGRRLYVYGWYPSWSILSARDRKPQHRIINACATTAASGRRNTARGAARLL